MAVVDRVGPQVLRQIPGFVAVREPSADRLEDPLRVDGQRGAHDRFRRELVLVAEASAAPRRDCCRSAGRAPCRCGCAARGGCPCRCCRGSRRPGPARDIMPTRSIHLADLGKFDVLATAHGVEIAGLQQQQRVQQFLGLSPVRVGVEPLDVRAAQIDRLAVEQEHPFGMPLPDLSACVINGEAPATEQHVLCVRAFRRVDAAAVKIRCFGRPDFRLRHRNIQRLRALAPRQLDALLSLVGPALAVLRQQLHLHTPPAAPARCPVRLFTRALPSDRSLRAKIADTRTGPVCSRYTSR